MKDNLLSIVNKEKLSIQNMLRFLKNLDKNLKDPVSCLDEMKQNIQKLRQYLQKSYLNEGFKRQILHYLESIEGNIPKWEEKRRNNFGFLLEEELSKIGLSLTGQYPLLKTYLFTIEILFDRAKIVLWYGPQQEKLSTSPIKIERIFKQIKDAYTTLKERKINDSSFLKTLHEAYKTWLFRKNKKSGDEAPILEILSEYAFLIQGKGFKLNPIKENFKSYGRVQFSYDLFLLKKRQLEGIELDLIAATRSYTRKKSGFLWIPTDLKGNGIYISHIRFREV